MKRRKASNGSSLQKNIEHRLGEQMVKTISVCDREADVFEYTLYKLKHNQRFIVRATQNRTLLDNDKRLFDAVTETPVLGSYTITVPQRGGGRRERKATLQVKSKSVTIQSPQRPGGRLQPLKVNVVTAQEISNGTKDKLCWILLTTEPVKTFDDCRRVLHFYELRWRIKEFHKAWKTGAGVERQRMQSADNLERMAVILMFVAVRLIQIREALILPYNRKQTGGEVWHEKTSADQVVSDDVWQVLIPNTQVALVGWPFGKGGSNYKSV